MSVPQRVYGLIFNLGNSGQFRLEPLVLGIERIWLRWFRPGVHLSLYLSSEKLEEVSVELFLNYSSLMEGWSWCSRSESLERQSGKNKNTLTVSFSPLPPPLLRAHWGDPSQPRFMYTHTCSPLSLRPPLKWKSRRTHPDLMKPPVLTKVSLGNFCSDHQSLHFAWLWFQS